MDSVRRATLDDVPTLVALMGDFYAESGFPLPVEAATRAFAALLGDQRLGAAWILEVDGKPAGHVVLTVSFSMEYGGLRGFVDDLFVRAAFRGRGLAAEGLATLRAEAEARGVRALLVESDGGDERAQRVYRRAGFEPCDHLLLTLPLADPVHRG